MVVQLQDNVKVLQQSAATSSSSSTDIELQLLPGAGSLAKRQRMADPNQDVVVPASHLKCLDESLTRLITLTQSSQMFSESMAIQYKSEREVAEQTQKTLRAIVMRSYDENRTQK